MHYSKTAFGKRDGEGDILQTIRKKTKYGNPTDDLGQPANGGLTYIDQRQLNRIYCEHSRNLLVPSELSQIIRHTIQENPAQTIEEFGPVLVLKFQKIYPSYYYLVHVWHSGFQQAAVKQRGSSCVTIADQGKRHVIICYARQRRGHGSPEGPVNQIERAVEARIRALGTCDVTRLAQEAFNKASSVNTGPDVVAAVIVYQEKERYYIHSYIHRLKGTRIPCDDVRKVGYRLVYA